MASNTPTMGKRALIDKANSTMVIAIAVAGFLVVFALFASKALLSQRSYQSRVIGKKEAAVDQLKANQEAVDKLAVNYKAFVETQDNVIGGNPNGSGDRDGNNAKIVLDAMPSKYDFPAFITSVEKLLKTKNFELTSVGGTDDEVTQTGTQDNAPDAPVEIPFQFSTEVGSYNRVKDALSLLEQSIRPISVRKLTITGGGPGSPITMQTEAVSYYLGAKGVTVTKETQK